MLQWLCFLTLDTVSKKRCLPGSLRFSQSGSGLRNHSHVQCFNYYNLYLHVSPCINLGPYRSSKLRIYAKRDALLQRFSLLSVQSTMLKN